MKLDKLLMVTALATGVTFGAFIDSAEARGSGSRPGGGIMADLVTLEKNIDGDFEEGGYDFKLFELDIFNQPRILTNGAFLGAIEDFNLIIYENENNAGDNFLISNNIDNPNIIKDAILDLTPRSVAAGSTISLLNGASIPLSPGLRGNQDSAPFFVETQTDRIEYTLTDSLGSSRLSDIGINEITLFIDNPESFNINGDLAVRDIEYIIDKNLFAQINGLRVIGIGNNGITIFSENDVNNSESVLIPEPNSVPESSSIIGLLMLGGFGTSLILKKSRKSY